EAGSVARFVTETRANAITSAPLASCFGNNSAAAASGTAGPGRAKVALLAGPIGVGTDAAAQVERALHTVVHVGNFDDRGVVGEIGCCCSAGNECGSCHHHRSDELTHVKGPQLLDTCRLQPISDVSLKVRLT